MAQTKKKRRRSKHRGTAAGTIESRGRTGRKPTSAERKGDTGGGSAKPTAEERREQRMNREPTWRSAAIRALISAVFVLAVLLFGFRRPIGAAVLVAVLLTLFYIPVGYYTDLFIWRRRQRKQGKG